jgi:hypothetical protein
MSLVTREGKGSKLTIAEMDGNLTYLEQLATESGGSEYTETIVDISSAQILNMGTTPIELLPELGSGQYYEVGKMIIEYTHNTSAYNSTSNWLYTDGGYHAFFASIIKNASNRLSMSGFPVASIDAAAGVASYGDNEVSYFNKLKLSTWDADDPTDGDGTLRVKIYHKTITFGA